MPVSVDLMCSILHRWLTYRSAGVRPISERSVADSGEFRRSRSRIAWPRFSSRALCCQIIWARKISLSSVNLECLHKCRLSRSDLQGCCAAADSCRCWSVNETNHLQRDRVMGQVLRSRARLLLVTKRHRSATRLLRGTTKMVEMRAPQLSASPPCLHAVARAVYDRHVWT
jgi:hypothetical protein